MLRFLLLLFLLIPLLEIYLLIKVGGLIGAIPTVALVVLTAVLGAVLIRWQGFTTMNRVRQTLAQGEIPAIEMMEGVVLLLSGALLLTPGFFTDILGFLALVPSLRRAAIMALLRRNQIMNQGGPSSRSGHEQQGPRTIEGEFWREDKHKPE